MVCIGRLDILPYRLQPSDRCVQQAHDYPPLLTSLGSAQLCLQASRSKKLSAGVQGRCHPHGLRWENELSIPDFQPSDRCGLQAHQLLSSPRLWQLSARQSSSLVMGAACWCAGSLPPSWSELGKLSYFNLTSNHLTGAASKPPGAVISNVSGSSQLGSQPSLYDSLQGCCHPHGLRWEASAALAWITRIRGPLCISNHEAWCTPHRRCLACGVAGHGRPAGPGPYRQCAQWNPAGRVGRSPHA